MSRNLHALTPCPPKGWNSYDSFGCFINEARALANLRVFAERLKPHGYEYFVIDAGWFRRYDLAGREFPGANDPYTVDFDAYGRPVPTPGFFPRGVKPLADACHAAGVKFGIHMMRGIPRAAVTANTPVLGTSYRAQDIAKVTSTCTWCPDNYGVDMTRPGAQAYYDSVIALLAEWGVDFIKYDDIIPVPSEVDAVVSAIERCPRDIVLSLSPGNGHESDGWDSYFRANMFRTTGDVWDDRNDMRWVFTRWQEFMPMVDRVPRGCWLDMDMIPFGELQVWNEGGPHGHILMNGVGTRRMCLLNAAQKRSFMAMRALGASPLMMGGNLPATDDESFTLLTHADVLACNNNGVVGKLVAYTDATNTWRTPHRSQPNTGWLGVFSRHETATQQVMLDAETLGLPKATRIFDIWQQKHLGTLSTPLSVTLGPDDVLFARYCPA